MSAAKHAAKQAATSGGTSAAASATSGDARPDSGQDLRVLVGYSPDERGDDALALGSLAARTAGAPLVVANVHPPAWPARGPGSVDAEWLSYLREQAAAALAQAADRLAALKHPKRGVEFRVLAHRGSGRGLLEIADEVGANLAVIGSAPRGRRDRIAIGSTADQLLHGSPIPVMLAPRGYAESAPKRFERLSVAYFRRRDVQTPLNAVATLAAALGLPVRLVTLVLRPSGLPARFRGKDDVLQRQYEQAERDLDHARGLLADRGVEDVETEAVQGAGITKALGGVEMLPGELLATMSSHEGPLRKVFLGESSGKIVRASGVPVLVLPRGHAR
ncbi:universal stress protein [Actinomadura rupiterrae]|uniref:universal stress protein n=1 Tax=Actinomadura rupiterrae TaxID=559627 RepID=UPI0020A3CB7B|nr:universal stress protein [Actinomadura rupiterrae]MCP2341275.1 nucleotide-binding universal stress UspA family protein [Actinomadura rupiterrae]